MRLFLISIALMMAFPLSAQLLPYKDKTLPVEKRVEDLVGRMTMDEKLAQIRHIHSSNVYNGQDLDRERLQSFCQGIGWGFVEGFYLSAENCAKNFKAIQKYMVEETRLGIPIFTIGESIHGMVQENSTIYPHNIALGSTFDPLLAYEKAKYLTGELHTAGIKQVLAPCIDVARDLRWGRIEECYGEDPYLCGIMAIAEVDGYIDNGISPMLKHFGPHGNPVGGLNLAAVECGVRDLHDVYLRPFEMVIKNTDIQAVMSSYNSWNRIPNSSSKYMMTEILRNRWGFKGYVYSDWGAIDMLRTFHKITEDPEEAAVLALTAGLDVEASSNTYAHLPALIKDGVVSMTDLDLAVSRVLYAKFKTGLFDDPYGLAYESKKTKRGPKSQALSKLIADESTVLLKNENNILPLDVNEIKSLAIIGPNADQVQFGGYTWSKKNDDGITPLAGIKALVGDKVELNYAFGCSIASLDTKDIAEAVEAAQKSDIAIVFVGSSSEAFVRYTQSPVTMGEGYDLSDISLTGAQNQLIEAVHATGKPLIVVLVSGKPFAIPWVKENAEAVVAQWYAGEQEGASIADILFGNVNPSGKLTYSFPNGTGNLPCYYNHLPSDRGFYKKHGSYEKSGRDYVFSSPEALWSFGYGLSYTSFNINNASADKKKYNESDTIYVDVKVENTGKRFGKEVVQVYVRDVASSIITPVKLLKAFQKVGLEAGETKSCRLAIPVSELQITGEDGKAFFEAGEFDLMVGNSSDNIAQTIRVDVGDFVKIRKQEDLRTPKSADELKGGKTITIKGVVRDLQGVPIVEANVHGQTETAKKTMTDKQGGFTIKLNEKDRIVFSKKGHISVVDDINGRGVVNAQLNYE